MANHVSSKKRIRRDERATRVNADRRNRIRTFIKKIEAAVSAGDSSGAEKALKEAQPEMQRGVAKGIWHKKTASRKMSRLSALVKATKK